MPQTFAWVDNFQYVNGQPIRVFPVGQFKRGERTIDLSDNRLAEIAQNYNERHLPNRAIPLYAGHPTEANPDPAKMGNVSKLEHRPGDGLYAYPEYTEAGKKSIDAGEYQYTSPGILWDLNGSSYTDDKGQEFNNVIDHVALTNRPFFGYQTAIFSDDNGIETKAQTEYFKAYSADDRKRLADSGAARPDGSYPIMSAEDVSNAVKDYGRSSGSTADKAHIVKRAKELKATDSLPTDWDGSTQTDNSDDKDTDTMSDKLVTPEMLADIQKKAADEFEARLKTQTELFETKLADERKKNDEFAVRLAATEKARELDVLRHEATDSFAFIPGFTADEYAEKMYGLKKIDPALAKWVKDEFTLLETAMAQSSLFKQINRQDANTAVETIETVTQKILDDKFKGDSKHYAEAFTQAGLARPDLAEAYSNKTGAK